MLSNLLYALLFPGLLTCAFAGLLFAGIDRRLAARMQRRVGPPVTQCFWDFVKLLGKEVIVPDAASPRVFLAAPVVGLAAIASCAVILPVFGLGRFVFTGDVIVLLYLLTLASVALIAGGAVNSDAPRAAVYALCFADPFAWMAADAVLLVPFLRNIMKMDYRYLKGTM